MIYDEGNFRIAMGSNFTIDAGACASSMSVL